MDFGNEKSWHPISKILYIGNKKNWHPTSKILYIGNNNGGDHDVDLHMWEIYMQNSSREYLS